ncbi:helix-turn-helix transcriptional regulator [Texcoconibacillus texcoconensis]|uniref:helix-turn-helix transcriptional regulator n=1 Tax=Texcoconibacillus texcoconensis TaxID=1095777 RepID=UPI001C8565A9|nr:helix-turn-helix transcriptional regulator [Texcoconibacillus texcoconensis]
MKCIFEHLFNRRGPLRVVRTIELNDRQEQILKIVKERGPITGERIADELSLTRATLRPDLAILTMAGFLEARPRVGYFYTGKTGLQLLTERMKKLTVHDYQSIPVVVNESASVYDAIVTMFLEDVGTLFVVDHNSHLVGVLSRKDLLRASIGKQELESIPVSIIMTRMPNITICEQEDFLLEMAKELIDKQIDGIPVVKKVEEDEQIRYEVVGRLTKTNITRAFVDLTNGEIT